MSSQLLGKETRMNRLFNPESGKFMAIMLDHWIGRGFQDGLIPIQNVINKIMEAAPDSITMQKGIAYNCFDQYAGKGTALIFRCSSFAVPYHPNRDAMFGDVEEALMAGADAVSIGAILGHKDQAPMLEQVARMAKDCTRWGMPLVGHIYPNGEMLAKSKAPEWQKVAYAARAGAELGVDILKIHFNGTPDELAKIVACVPTNVVLAGGSSGRNIEDYLVMTRNAIDAGVAGVAYGRFVWQYPNIPALIQTLKLIIHKNASVKEAMEYLTELDAH